MCQIPVAVLWVSEVCLSHSGWIRRKWWQRSNASRLGALGTVHFSPEAEGGPLVTLMDRNAAHPPTHTHTPTHVPHTQSCTSTSSQKDTRTITHKLLRPSRSDVQCEMFTTRPHGLPALSINSSQKYVWCIIIYMPARGGCSSILHHRLTHVHPGATCSTESDIVG